MTLRIRDHPYRQDPGCYFLKILMVQDGIKPAPLIGFNFRLCLGFHVLEQGLRGRFFHLFQTGKIISVENRKAEIHFFDFFFIFTDISLRIEGHVALRLSDLFLTAFFGNNVLGLLFFDSLFRLLLFDDFLGLFFFDGLFRLLLFDDLLSLLLFDGLPVLFFDLFFRLFFGLLFFLLRLLCLLLLFLL